MDAYFILGAWSLILIAYSILIPNTWQRALVLLGPASLLPYLNFYLVGLYEPKVREAFDSLQHSTPASQPLVALFTAVYCAHTLHRFRRAEFEVRQLGQYRLKEKLGAGGMGEVYRGEHHLLKRPCAIKLIRPGIDADPRAISRFEREVQATASLSHVNTVEIYDYGITQEGTFYYVMELLDGVTLGDLVERYGPMPAERAVYFLRQVCDALGEAHAKGMIHRDVKPGNIFAARRGGACDFAKLLDFGLVKHTASLDASQTQDHMISGSPPFMSPEQASPGQPIDARSDLYSLGAVAYFLVTGQPPFLGRTPMDYIVAHARDPVVPPALRNPQVPADLDAVILKCLEKQADRRFEDAAALRRALDDCTCSAAWDEARAERWWQEHPLEKVAHADLANTASIRATPNSVQTQARVASPG